MNKCSHCNVSSNTGHWTQAPPGTDGCAKPMVYTLHWQHAASTLHKFKNRTWHVQSFLTSRTIQPTIKSHPPSLRTEEPPNLNLQKAPPKSTKEIARVWNFFFFWVTNTWLCVWRCSSPCFRSFLLLGSLQSSNVQALRQTQVLTAQSQC